MKKTIIIFLTAAFILTNTGLVYAVEESGSQQKEKPTAANQSVSIASEEAVNLGSGLTDDDPGQISPFHQESTSFSPNNIRGLSGSFNVDQFSGAATYREELALAPGRASFNPKLVLSYNSHQQNCDSLIGLGWDLAQSFVLRSAKAVDKLYTANEFTLVLNGQSLELVPVNLIDETHGEYGARFEENFYKIEFLTNDSWQITSKSGQTFTFGTVAATRQDNPENSTMIYRWLLEKISDTNENYISYEYYKEAGQIYPKKISYTGHGTTPGLVEIRFEPFYSGPTTGDVRADVHRSFLPQFEVLTKYLIEEIVIFVSGQAERKYQFDYSSGENSKDSLLTSYQRFDYNNSEWQSLPATTFTYQTASQVWQNQAANWENPIASYLFNNITHTYGRGPLDVDGDGWSDYAVSGGALVNPKNSEVWSQDYTGLPNYPLDVGFFADINGDRLMDFIGEVDSQTVVRINNPTTQSWAQSTLWTNNLPAGINPNFVDDVNGDGLADLLQVYYNSVSDQWSAKIYFNNGDTTWTRKESWESSIIFTNPSWQEGMLLADVNNDGLVDMIKAWGSYLYAPHGVYLNNGQGWPDTPNFGYFPGGVDGWMYGGNRLADINNDGWVDVVISFNNSSEVYINNGQDWLLDNSWIIPLQFISPTFNPIGWLDLGVRLYDINGDGLVDILKRLDDEGGPTQNAAYIAQGEKPNLLSEINNGYGGTTEIEYQSSARIQDQSLVFRNEELPFVLQVVKEVVTNDGLGNLQQTEYEFYDASYYVDSLDPQESQFAGFHQVNQIQGDKVIKSYFHQGGGINGQAFGEFEDHIAKKGRMYRQEVYQSAGGQQQLLKQTINKWVKEDLGASRSFVKLASTVNYDFEDGVMVDSSQKKSNNSLPQKQVLSPAPASKASTTITSVQEVESMRTINSKSYLVGQTQDGKPIYKMKVYTHPIHYQDQNGQLQDIDTTLIDNGVSWQMSRAAYQASLPKELSANRGLSFYNQNQEITLAPVNISWSLADQSKLLLNQAQNSLGEQVNNQIKYPNAFGAGLDLEATLLNQALRKELVINNLDSLGVINKQAENLEVTFEFLDLDKSIIKLTNENGRIKELSTESDSFSEVTAATIELTDSHGQTSYLWSPYAIDAAGQHAVIKFRISKENGRLYLSKIIPLTWLKAASFPVRTDATVSYLSGTGDGYIYKMASTWGGAREATSGVPDSSGTLANVSASHGVNVYCIERAFLPFYTISLSPDATILSASLYFHSTQTYGSPLVHLVQTTQNSTSGLSSGDYDEVGNISGGSIQVPAWDDYYLPLNETAFNWLVPGGWTKIGLRSSYDLDNNEPPLGGGGSLSLYTAEYTNYHPALEITYTLNNAPPAPTALETEGQTNPIDVTDQNPEFSAVYNDENLSDQATHYQIQVIEEGGSFANSSDIIWDSTKTALASPVPVGQRCLEIEYGASPIALDGVRYFWRLKFWDNGDPLNNEGAWSDGTDYFEMDGSLPPTTPTDLLTEGYVNPTEVVDQTPEFSAVYHDPNPQDLAKWYQIQVDDNPDFSSAVWDSQKTLLSQLLDNGFRSEDIAYGGQALAHDGTTYYWRIKFWDDEGENGTEGAWSQAGLFTMFNTANLLDNGKFTVIEYEYNLTNGNLIQERSLGQVNAADNGIYLDISGDSRTTDYEYAESPTQNIKSAIKKQKLTNVQTLEQTEQEIYYDNLPYGQVVVGNPTKEDLIINNIEYNYSFDDFGQVTQKKDPLNHSIIISYDAVGYYPTSTTNALNQTVLTAYDLTTGQILTTTDPNGLVEERTYDAFGRLLEVKRSDPQNPANLISLETYEYHDVVAPFWVKKSVRVDSTNWVDSYVYFDGLGRVIQTRQESAGANQYIVVSYQYDENGNLAAQTLPIYETGSSYQAPNWSTTIVNQYTYDSLGRVLSEITPVGTTTYEYSEWKTAVTDANGNIKNYYRDAYNQLVKVEEILNSQTYSTNYTYSYLGKITQIKDSQNNERNFTYDSLGRLINQEEMHKPGASSWGIWSFVYDAASNLILKTDAKNQTVNYTYDSLNRVLTEDSNTTGQMDISYVYDTVPFGIGRLTSATKNTSPIIITSYAYDIWGRTLVETKNIKDRIFNTSFAYNLSNQPLTITYPDNFLTRYTYSLVGQTNQVFITESGGLEQSIVNSVNYSPIGQIQEINYQNGTISQMTYPLEQAYRLTQKETTTSTTTLQDLSYVYDNVGNITQIIDTAPNQLAKTSTFSYDDLYRLTSATIINNYTSSTTVQTFSYDVIGNMLFKSDIGNYQYTYDNPYQASTINGQTYTYDDNGNLTADGTRSMVYDYMDRMSSVTVNSRTTNYYYDHSKTRVVKQNPRTQAYTMYPNKYYEKSNNKEERYIFLGNQRLGIVEKPNGQNPTLYLNFTDHLNSSSVTTDVDGDITNLIDYFPYGSERVNIQNGNLNVAYQFTDKELDSESGLNYFGSRYYNAAIGRFTQSDPLALYITNEHKIKQEFNQELVDILADPQLLNSYSYSRNNPLIYKDPSGELVMVIALPGLVISAVLSAGVIMLTYELIPGVQEAWTKVITDVYEATKAIISTILFARSQQNILDKINELNKPIQEHIDKLNNPNEPGGKDPDTRNKWKKDIEKFIEKQKKWVEKLKIQKTKEKVTEEINRKIEEVEKIPVAVEQPEDTTNKNDDANQ